MSVLEKILEEIKKEQNSYEANHAWNYSKGLEYAKEIVRQHMDDAPDTNVGQWIPTSERLPNEEEFVKAYCRNHHCAEFIVTAKNLIIQAIEEGEDIEMCREQCCKGCTKICGFRCMAIQGG